jgi:hypothetical protein
MIPRTSALLVSCVRRRFPRGVLGGARYAPPWLQHCNGSGQCPENFFGGRFLLFLADFAIFSGFVN